MKANGFDVNIGVEGVLVEENRAVCTMSHVEPTSKKVMIDILSCLLQRNDMSLTCNLFLEGIFFSPSVSRVSVVDAEPPLHR